MFSYLDTFCWDHHGGEYEVLKHIVVFRDIIFSVKERIHIFHLDGFYTFNLPQNTTLD